MDDTKKELDKIKLENEVFNTQIEMLKESMSMRLENGLGDEIRLTLKNPKKISRYKIIKNKISNYINKILEIL